jgi:hypothetical protein
MPDNSQSDLSFQPATKAYAFPATPVVPPATPQPEPEPEQKLKSPRKPINWKPFFLLLGVITSLTLVFLIFLGALNYLRVISLSGIYPNQLGWLPQITQPPAPTYNSYDSLWTANGTFYGYNNYALKITINNQVKDFQWSNGNSAAVLYGSETDLGDPNALSTHYTLFDLEQNQNLGKKIIIEYKIENGKNVINNLNLFQL